mmetsp:Transcript_72044/g.141309  ORF Transcript_72044/g.141309 Transcript_72044/m.141309 type:complete len:164 (+) Transcript_72044:86-577(+)|eukprot:CAMPEP_0171599104 /NCGR_PEP_ID=MMETSP0990-20121206/3530_1 /TAXON_ID=483369 /ORGANISM="non described non described, Strain CCMP2098" /LENGTH=163 /DNA_ID=CAMNT_0012160809 /DNA_START=96 /DNA_END=587 /DNA_ORIENTATION=+
MFSRSKPAASQNLTPDEEILVSVSSKMLSTDRFVEQWRSFMSENNEEFHKKSQAKEADNGEFSLSATEIHRSFTELVELQLEEALTDLGVTVNQFMNICSDLDGSAGQDEQIQGFLQFVLGATEFSVFADIMRSVEKRNYYFQILGMWKSSLKQNSHPCAEAK